MKKKFLSMITAIVMLISLLPQGIITVSAAMRGSGTMSDPYIITTAAELSTIGGEENKNKYFRLGNNIAVDSSFSTIDTFYGILDGDGHSIAGVNIIDTKTETERTEQGRLFNTIKSTGIVYGLRILSPKYTLVMNATTDSYKTFWLDRGLFVNTNQGLISGLSIEDAKVNLDLATNNGTKQWTLADFGIIAYSNSGSAARILNSNVTGTMNISQCRYVGAIVGSNSNNATIANVTSDVTIIYNAQSSQDGFDYFSNGVGFNKSGGKLYNVWVWGKSAKASWTTTLYDTGVVAGKNSGSIEKCYHNILSGSVISKPIGTGSGDVTAFTGTSVDLNTYNSNTTTKKSEIPGLQTGNPALAYQNDLYFIELYRTSSELISTAVCADGDSITLPISLDDDYYCDSWKNKSGTTYNSGRSVDVTGNDTYTAQNIKGKYYLEYDGVSKQILPTDSLPVNYPYEWRHIGESSSVSAPSGVTVTKEIAKVNSWSKPNTFESSYTGTLATGDKFCYRYIVESTNDRVKTGTYNMYIEDSSGYVTVPSYTVEKNTITSSNYADFISLTVPTGEVYLAEGGYNYPTAQAKTGISVAPTGAITLSYMDSEGTTLTDAPTSVGEYKVLLSVAEDTNFYVANNIETGKTYKIDKATPLIITKVQPSNATYGSSITVTADVKAKLKGDGTTGYISGGTATLTFKENGVIDDSKTQTKNVEGTSLEFTVADLPDEGTPCEYTIEYSGNDNYNSVSVSDTPRHVHSWATEWSKDETYHWHECTAEDCYVTDNAQKDGYAAHTYDQQVATDEYKASDATGTARATYYKSCVCGATGTETFESGDCSSQPAEWDATNNRYEIGNAGQLYWFAQQVNGGTTDINAVLTADIDLSCIDNWTPIGNETNKYTGTFDGQNHTVKDMSITKQGNNSGLFGYTDHATIKNIIITGEITITAESYTEGYGSIAGRADNHTTVTNCHSSVNITIDSTMESTAGSCIGHIGGIIGKMHYADSPISNCSYSGTIELKDKPINVAAGIVGYATYSTVPITNCSFTGKINSTYTGTGEKIIGGIFGYTRTSNAVKVTNCLSVGTITISGDTSKTGILIGMINGGYGKNEVKNNYYTSSSLNVIGSKTGTPTTVPATLKTVEEVASGEVAYLLNGSTSVGTLAWGQDLSADTYPVLTSDIAKKVLKVEFKTLGADGEYTLYADKYGNYDKVLSDFPEEITGTIWIDGVNQFTASSTVTEDKTVYTVGYSVKYNDDGKVVISAPKPGNYKITIASYSGKSLLKVQSADITLESWDDSYEITDLNGFDTTGADTVKVFFWDTEMRPQCIPAV